ncbi:hypothetical protein C8Q77DRAFT_337323 [Trametes polyzona]|nr:hypothetical protein C8Q77DRAFT_337323 [Trametes polyzona]
MYAGLLGQPTSILAHPCAPAPRPAAEGRPRFTFHHIAEKFGMQGSVASTRRRCECRLPYSKRPLDRDSRHWPGGWYGSHTVTTGVIGPMSRHSQRAVGPLVPSCRYQERRERMHDRHRSTHMCSLARVTDGFVLPAAGELTRPPREPKRAQPSCTTREWCFPKASTCVYGRPDDENIRERRLARCMREHPPIRRSMSVMPAAREDADGPVSAG